MEEMQQEIQQGPGTGTQYGAGQEAAKAQQPVEAQQPEGPGNIEAMQELKTPHGTIGNFGLRCITGAVYILVLAGFFALKIFLSDLFFDALILLFAVVGTWEMTRAFKGKLHASQVTIVMVFSAIVILTYAVSDFIFQDVLEVKLPDSGVSEETIRSLVGRNYALHITFVAILAGVSVLLGLLVFAHGQVSLESTGCAMLCYVYPTFLLLVLSICNHLQSYSELAVMFVFIVAPASDAMAYFFGKLFGKKLPLKMAPSISPKKTVIGGFGGLIGGAIGAVIIFFMYYGLMRLDDLGVTAQVIRNMSVTPLNLIFFIGLGVVTSAFSQFGDLVESAIKRKIGIKDMGKILPGHGGILDRIDSALYAGLIVCLVMVLRLMFVG